MIYIHNYIIFAYKSQCFTYNKNMNVREEVKVLLMAKGMTLTALAEKMKRITGKNYTQSLLSHKLKDETLKYSEMKIICKILGYKIKILTKD